MNSTYVLALVKDDERFLFRYDDAGRTELLKTFGRFASRDDINFTWYDAAVLSQRVRQEAADRSSHGWQGRNHGRTPTES